jgi:hypothetical protein
MECRKMKSSFSVMIIILSLSSSLFSIFGKGWASIPVTGASITATNRSETRLQNGPAAEQANAQLTLDRAQGLSQVVFNDGTTLAIGRQPRGNISYITSHPEELTLFSLTQKFDSIGLLAHNYLAGEYFFNLAINDQVHLILDDGSNRQFEVVEIHQFQAVNPHSIHTNFIDLETGETVSAHQLFLRMYGSAGALTLQTCIERDGHMEWGRQFIIARPVSGG